MAIFAVVRKIMLRVSVAAIAMLGGRSLVHAQGSSEPLTILPKSAAAPDPTTAPLPDSTQPPSGTDWGKGTDLAIEASGEHWTGFEGYRRSVSLYSGLTWSPFTNLRQDGLRLRAISGQSIYSYSGGRYDLASNSTVWQQFFGQGRFIDALAGWQFSGGGTTAKVFAGYGYVSNIITPYDPETRIQGTARGAKVVGEVWHNWNSTVYSSLDVSVAQAHRAYSAQARTGWRFDLGDGPAWSFGPEIGQIGHTETTVSRAGLFVRYESVDFEFTIVGGAARTANDSPMGYGSAQYLKRF